MRPRLASGQEATALPVPDCEPSLGEEVKVVGWCRGGCRWEPAGGDTPGLLGPQRAPLHSVVAGRDISKLMGLTCQHQGRVARMPKAPS